MRTVTYTAITSLDGFIEDREGRFDWAVPDQEAHAFINEVERAAGTHLYGRRMYETMAGWERDTAVTTGSPASLEFAKIWRAADKIVYSRTLAAVRTARTRLERAFDAERVARLKAGAGPGISIGGAELAAHGFRAGLVDDYHLFIAPISVGGGKRALPDDRRIELELASQRRFAGGMVHLHYRVVPPRRAG